MKLKILRPFAAVSPPRPSQFDCALKQIRQWLVDRDQQVFLLHGFAGTGKTTLAVRVGQMVGPTAFAALTGKAASRLVEAGAPRERTSTLHKLLFRSVWDEVRKRFVHTPREPHEFAHLALIIVDEASMVGKTMARHLMVTGRPLLIVGDPFQLPPVADDTSPFMVERPDALLTEVYRQARDNPILRVATAIREGTFWRRHVDDDRVRVVDCWEDADVPDMLVCGTNTTRWRTNLQMRRALGIARFSREPTAGEKVVCLRNDCGVDVPVFNGETWVIERVGPTNILGTPAYDLNLISNLYAARTKVTVPASFFETGDPPFELKNSSLYQEFSWGYAITAHKAQGSEWPSVAVIDESDVFRDMSQRWLYTAVTRASERLTIVCSKE